MKEEYKVQNRIIEEIRTFRNEYQIADFIEANIPNELLENEAFLDKLLAANLLVENALEILNVKKVVNNIKVEIQEKGLENVIEDEEKLRDIPKEYKEQLFNIAQKYETEEEFEKAKKVYGRIVEFGATQVDRFNERYKRNEERRETIYYKSKYAYYLCKIQNGEELTDEDRKELEQLAKEDKDNILNLRNQGHMTDYELYEALFEDITLEQIETEILPMIQDSEHKGKKTITGSNQNSSETREYIEALSPDKRLKFIKENYEIESCKVGKGKLTGTVIFKVKNSDVVIVEKFFSTEGRKNEKKIVPSNSTSTFFVHKDAKIDFESASRSMLVERKEEEKRGDKPRLIIAIYHRGETYYDRFKETFNTVAENGEKRRIIEEQEKDGAEAITDRDNNAIDLGENIEPITTKGNNNPEIEEVLKTIEIAAEPEPDSDIREEENRDETIEELEETPVVNNQAQPIELEEESVEERDSEEVKEDLSVYTTDDLIAYAQLLDEELETFEKELNETNKNVSETEGIVKVLKERLTNKFKENLSIITRQEGLRKDLISLEDLKAKLNELLQIKEKILEAKSKNRAERDRVQKEFNKRILGE